LQIAFVLPSAMIIGWLGGAWADSKLHQKWITIVGVSLWLRCRPVLCDPLGDGRGEECRQSGGVEQDRNRFGLHEMTTQETHPIVDLTDEALQTMLKRALWITVVLGALASAVVAIGSNWRNGAMLLTGAAISAASILEWRHSGSGLQCADGQAADPDERSSGGDLLCDAARTVRRGDLW
jgi:hypothetical protein